MRNALKPQNRRKKNWYIFRSAAALLFFISQQERRGVLEPHLFMRCKIFFRQLYHRAGKKEYTNQIWNNHQTIKGIRDIPQ